MHRWLSVGRDGKTADERSVGRRRVFLPWHSSVSERRACLCSHPTVVWAPLDSRFEQGGNLGPMQGSIAVLVGAANGVVKARTIKRLPSERWNSSFLDEAHGGELARNELEDAGSRVGIRAPVLKPHAAVPSPPLVPEFRKVRRAPPRRADFQQFGCADSCPGCAKARAGRKQAVDRSEQCRSSMEATWRRPLKGFFDWSEPRSVLLSLPRNRSVAMRAKGRQPRAPPASRVLESVVRSNNQEGGSSSSGSAMPASDSPPLEKRGL